MLLNDQPRAVQLAQDVRRSHRDCQPATVAPRDKTAHDAVRVGDLAVDRNAQVGDLLVKRARKRGKQILPVLLIVLPADMLSRWGDIKDEQVRPAYIERHDGRDVLPVESLDRSEERR